MLVRSELVRTRYADTVMEIGFEPVCNQLRTSFESASVMEFGFYYTFASFAHTFTKLIDRRIPIIALRSRCCCRIAEARGVAEKCQGTQMPRIILTHSTLSISDSPLLASVISSLPVDSPLSIATLSYTLIMAALCNRAGHYILPCGFYLSFFLLFSSPNLSGLRLDIYQQGCAMVADASSLIHSVNLIPACSYVTLLFLYTC